MLQKFSLVAAASIIEAKNFLFCFFSSETVEQLIRRTEAAPPSTDKNPVEKMIEENSWTLLFNKIYASNLDLRHFESEPLSY